MRWVTIVAGIAFAGCSNPAEPIDVKLCNITYVGPECRYRGPDGPSEVDLTVVLVNEDTLPVHILKGGEGYEPSNHLEPGTERSLTVKVAAGGFWLAWFRAGRDGTDLVTEFCQYSRPYKRPLGPAKVVWDGSRLACVDW